MTFAFGLPSVAPDCGIPVSSWLTALLVAVAAVPVWSPVFLAPPLEMMIPATTTTMAISTTPPSM